MAEDYTKALLAQAGDTPHDVPPNSSSSDPADLPDFASITHPKKHAFLLAYMQLGTITHAAGIARCSRFAVRLWLNPESQYYDEEFALAFKDARAGFGDVLENVLFEKVAHRETVPLIVALKGHFGAKYRDGVQQQVNIDNSQTTVIDGTAALKAFLAARKEAQALEAAQRAAAAEEDALAASPDRKEASGTTTDTTGAEPPF